MLSCNKLNWAYVQIRETMVTNAVTNEGSGAHGILRKSFKLAAREDHHLHAIGLR